MTFDYFKVPFMEQDEEISKYVSFRQLKFDDELNIVSERNFRELSSEEKAEYNRLTEGATQLCLEDFNL